MKMWLLIFMFCLSGSLLAESNFKPRTFTSKDGTKTLVATPVGYDRGRLMAHLRMQDGKVKVFDLSKFSVEDQLFFEDNAAALSRMLHEMNMLQKLPGAIKERFYKESRERLLREHRVVESEQALDRFFNYLKKTQNADGSWTPHNKTSMTAFALLAYLGRGETPLSGQYGDSITRGLVFLINTAMKNRGKIADELKDKHWPYEHAIATLALAEAQTICGAIGIRIPKLKEATKLAGEWILKHQHPSGGWDYHYDMSGVRGGDVSITSWHVQALAACKLTNLWSKRDFEIPIRKSLAYIRKMQNANGGVGYSSPIPSGNAGYSLTGAGVYTFQMWNKPHDSVVRKGVRYIRKEAKFGYDTEYADLYRHYYHALAMKHRGGDDWKFYNRLLGRQLIDNQEEDGSWKNVGGGAKPLAIAASYHSDNTAARHYRSCLCALILETPYRYKWVVPRAKP